MIDSRYQLLGKIAESARGTVFRAHDIEQHQDVAIKRPHVVDAPKREGDALSQIQHPNIISLVGLGSDDEGPFLVLELLPGETLEARVQKKALSIDETLSLAQQALSALSAVHEAGFIHRDLKPENMMMVPLEDGTFRVKLFDFDLAQPLDEAPTDNATGSVYFMAPEQFENKRPDVRTDLYALGAVLHYALTQRYPFDGDTKAQVITAHLYHDCLPLNLLRPDAPAALVEWLTHLVSRIPAQRPASAAEALAQLEVANFEAIEAQPEPS